MRVDKWLSRKVKIKFINIDNTIETLQLNEKEKEFITHEQIFNYSRTTRIKDLFSWINGNINRVNYYNVDEKFSLNIRGIINGKSYIIINDFSLNKYIKRNAIEGTLIFEYVTGIGAGYAGLLENGVRIFMNYNEKHHQRTPHVHVRKGKYLKNNSDDNTIRIRLSDISVMDKKAKKAKKIFDKDLKTICEFLTVHKEKFIENYNLMQRGVVPESAYYDLNDNSYYFTI